MAKSINFNGITTICGFTGMGEVNQRKSSVSNSTLVNFDTEIHYLDSADRPLRERRAGKSKMEEAIVAY